MARKSANQVQTEPKKRGPYTPQPVQARVIARHINGESSRRIATEEGIARGTVSKILSRQELIEMNARQYSRLQSMGDKALDVLDRALSCDDPRIAVPVAMKISECVLPKGGIEHAIQLAHNASPEVEAKEQRLRILAEIIAMGLEKHEKYGVPLSPSMERIKQELDAKLPKPQGLRPTESMLEKLGLKPASTLLADGGSQDRDPPE